MDGQVVEVIADLQGDELAPSNSLVWVPSLRAAIAGDLVYDDALAGAMRRKYPALGFPLILTFAAKAAFAN